MRKKFNRNGFYYYSYLLSHSFFSDIFMLINIYLTCHKKNADRPGIKTKKRGIARFHFERSLFLLFASYFRVCASTPEDVLVVNNL